MMERLEKASRKRERGYGMKGNGYVQGGAGREAAREKLDSEGAGRETRQRRQFYRGKETRRYRKAHLSPNYLTGHGCRGAGG